MERDAALNLLSQFGRGTGTSQCDERTAGRPTTRCPPHARLLLVVDELTGR